ncbi:DNA-binding response regulator [Neobacillus niacini]|uniref:DNA-binding response regulator n=1 Tax=Neobacillus niacini TaxID=86668 RepID=UPI002FFFB5EA
MTYNKFQIYGILKDYFWMLREIQRLDRELTKTDFRGTAQYGIEASLPHGQGIVSQAIENEVIRRSKKSDNMVEYARKVNFVNERFYKITDEKEKVILDCLLDGMSIIAISKHLGLSRRRVNELRDDIVDKLMSNNAQNAHM